MKTQTRKSRAISNFIKVMFKKKINYMIKDKMK